MDAKQYYDGLLKTAGVEDAARQALLGTLFADEKVAKALADDAVAPRLRQDDYSRKLDEVAGIKKRNEDWYAKEIKTQADMEAKRIEYEQKLAALGTTDDDTTRRTAITSVADVVTKKDLDELLAKRDMNTITIIKSATRMADDYRARFGKALDLDALEKVAVEKNLPLDIAYQQHIAPELEARRTTEFDEKLKAAKEEGAREFASTHKIPVDTKPREPHMIFDHKAPPADAPKPGSAEFERNLRGAFVDEWNKQPAAST